VAHADAYRELVEARAGGACEYCRLLQAGTGVTFHIEHLIDQLRTARAADARGRYRSTRNLS
jgi:hypothetical protein